MRSWCQCGQLRGRVVGVVSVVVGLRAMTPVKVVVGGGQTGNGQAGGNVMEALLTMLLSDRFGQMAVTSPAASANPETARLREQIRQSLASDGKKEASRA